MRFAYMTQRHAPYENWNWSHQILCEKSFQTAYVLPIFADPRVRLLKTSQTLFCVHFQLLNAVPSHPLCSMTKTEVKLNTAFMCVASFIRIIWDIITIIQINFYLMESNWIPTNNNNIQELSFRCTAADDPIVHSCPLP